MSERLAQHCELMRERNQVLTESLKNSVIQKKRAQCAMNKKQELLKEIDREILKHPKYKALKAKNRELVRDNLRLKEEKSGLVQKLSLLKSTAYKFYAMTKG